MSEMARTAAPVPATFESLCRPAECSGPGAIRGRRPPSQPRAAGAARPRARAPAASIPQRTRLATPADTTSARTEETTQAILDCCASELVRDVIDGAICDNQEEQSCDTYIESDAEHEVHQKFAAMMVSKASFVPQQTEAETDMQDYEDVYSLASDDEECEELDMDMEAFNIARIAFSFAKQAVKAGLEAELEAVEAEEKLEATVQAPAVVEVVEDATATTMVVADQIEPEPEEKDKQQQEQLQTKLEEIAAAPAPLEREAAPTAATTEAALSPKTPSKHRRKIIGAVVRPERLEEPEAKEVPRAAQMSPKMQMGLPEEFAPTFAGSPVAALRRSRSNLANQLNATKQQPLVFRMDAEESSASRCGTPAMSRSSSLTNAYAALGAELHSLDGPRFEPPALAGRRQAPVWSPPLGELKLTPSSSKAALKTALLGPFSSSSSKPAASFGFTAMAMDLEDFGESRRAPTPSTTNRASSLGALSSYKMTKQAPSLLPQLPARQVSAAPVDWSLGATRHTRMWGGAPAVF